jgi:TldD protein
MHRTMPSTRRQFLQTTGAAVTTAALTHALSPRPLLALLGERPEPVPPIQDPRLKTLVQRGLDAVMQAGAQYADVRLTHDRTRMISPGNVSDTEAMTVGVRALVDGYWGFSASPLWSPDEMVRLAHEAVSQAKINALGKPRVVELAPRPRIDDGHWVMPVKIDPFTVYPTQIMEHLDGLGNYINRQPYCSVSQNHCVFFQQEKAFGASDGSYYTQRTYRTGGFLGIQLATPTGRASDGIEELEMAAVGWELYADQPIRTYIDRTIEELKEEVKLPRKPVDVGRYDAVLSARALGIILSGTIGAATELDRALGYEANAGGTSYLQHPLEMLGTYKLSTSLLNVTATRNNPGGLAWVQWDDEGVRPETFPLVKDGVVVGFQTTRESAAWLRGARAVPADAPFKSLGCAAAPAADDAPLTHTPDLVLQPGAEDVDFNGLIATVSKGLAFSSLGVQLDFQQLNGMGQGKVYEIQHGKKVAILEGAGFLFRAPEFWKSLTALGGSKSAKRIARRGSKGQPTQTAYHTVTAVPGIFKDLSVIDPSRKA